MRFRRPVVWGLAVIALSACGGGEQGTGPTSENKPLAVLSGAGATDTVDARLPLALTIEVRVNGELRSGVIVRMEAVVSNDPLHAYDRTVQLASLSSNQFASFRADSTDAAGRVRTLVRLGAIAGEVRVAITVPEIGATDTARFTVRPGNVARVQLAVRDTAIRIGGTYSPGATVADRYGNPRGETVALDVGTNAASVTTSGAVTVGNVVGRGFVVARFGAVTDTARFTAVPNASIVALYVTPDYKYQVVSMDLDGANRKVVATTAQSATYPSTTHSGGLTVYHEENSAEGSTIYIVDSTGAKRRLLGSNVLYGARHARIDADGQYVYFSGRAAANAASLIWRIKADGTGLQQLTSSSVSYTDHSEASPSPDGTKFVYREDGVIVVRTLATGAKVRFTDGVLLRFSPDGQRIAYSTGISVAIANATGGTPTVLSQPYVDGGASMAWTSDGQWLLVRAYDGVCIISPTTGQYVVLPGGGSLYQIATRP